MKTEIWKKHPDIEGMEVSTLGNVRILDRPGSRENRTYSKKGRVLKQCYDKNGYMRVGITIDRKWTMKLVHRLVAQTFIKNPDNLHQINHKDCDRTNNHVENLEFCTASYNAKYREKYGLSNTEVLGHPLFAVNLNTLKVYRFRSQHEAGRELGLFNQNIRAVIKGNRKQTGGFWFVNDDDKATDAINNKLHKISKGW